MFVFDKVYFVLTGVDAACRCFGCLLATMVLTNLQIEIVYRNSAQSYTTYNFICAKTPKQKINPIISWYVFVPDHPIGLFETKSRINTLFLGLTCPRLMHCITCSCCLFLLNLFQSKKCCFCFCYLCVPYPKQFFSNFF